MVNKKYVENGGQVCPSCGCEDFEGGPVTVAEENCYQVVSCNECAAEWEDCYTLSDMCVTQKGDSLAFVEEALQTLLARVVKGSVAEKLCTKTLNRLKGWKTAQKSQRAAEERQRQIDNTAYPGSMGNLLLLVAGAFIKEYIGECVHSSQYRMTAGEWRELFAKWKSENFGGTEHEKEAENSQAAEGQAGSGNDTTRESREVSEIAETENHHFR